MVGKASGYRIVSFSERRHRRIALPLVRLRRGGGSLVAKNGQPIGNISV